MGDELFAGLASLVGVVFAGEEERSRDLSFIDASWRIALVLLDDREEVAQ
ncbi:MAG: hypothetical protein NTV40_03550 [Solirubrobacterales bacterium]|nr:hypothetical protein [Solirubrobacterales bacterium]